MNIVEYNEYLCQKFEETKDVGVLLRYVITESLSPICDYENMIRIIRRHKSAYKNATLLLLGAFWLTYWFRDEENDLLKELNLLRSSMSEEELAITYYLNACHLRFTNEDYKNHPEYRENLLLSIGCNVPFVDNRVLLAEISPLEEKQKLYVEALRNVIHVPTLSETMSTPDEIFAEPDKFIGEFITGTHPNSSHYMELLRDSYMAFCET